MMRLALAAALLASPALAQPAPPPPPPQQQALGQMVIEAMQREASLRAQIVTLQAELDAAKAAMPKPAEAPK